jgi:hypothetical protein
MGFLGYRAPTIKYRSTKLAILATFKLPNGGTKTVKVLRIRPNLFGYLIVVFRGGFIPKGCCTVKRVKKYV